MLSPRTIEIVKSTVPLLQAQGETLTRHFYQRMFTHNPEVKPFFSAAHQNNSHQQRALAAAITAYAANIDQLDKLQNAVQLITHKHASLQITAEQYPIVGENLLASIKEVLGDIATDEVINAWREAYTFLAELLINKEQQIYQQNAAQPGGWQGFRPFIVAKKDQESELITSFYLQPADNGLLPDYLAGQYITLRLPTADGSTTMRNYSLSDKAGHYYLRISVKREQGQQPGYVSNLLHDHIQVGDTLKVAPPCGDFCLTHDENSYRPLVFLAGGIGITPLMSMLLTELASNSPRPITFIHACLTPQVQAFKSTLDQLAKQYPQLTVYHRYSETMANVVQSHCSLGLVTAEWLADVVTDRQADYYFCGPTPFMNQLNQLLHDWQIAEQQIHFEFFGPRQTLASAA